MTRTKTISRAALLLAALAPAALFAQDRDEARPRLGPPGPPPGLFGRAPGGPAGSDRIEPARGAPFQARAVDEHTQTLSDGNRIARKATSSVWRDAEGRTRREVDGRVFIDDPVAGTGYVLDEQAKTAMQHPPFPGHHPPDGVPGMRDEGARKPGAPATQSLGTRTIEGLEATGTRTTVTIAA